MSSPAARFPPMGEAEGLMEPEGRSGSGRPPRVVESVLKATHLLDAYEAGRPEMTLSELVERGGYSKSTTYRLLLTLCSAGWLERTPHGTFRLTLKAFRLGSIVVDSLDLRREAIPIMSGLAKACGASAYLVIAAGRFAVCLERIDDGDTVRVADLQVGVTAAAHRCRAARVAGVQRGHPARSAAGSGPRVQNSGQHRRPRRATRGPGRDTPPRVQHLAG